MRCPDCDTRNSVAAKECLSCGRTFEKKVIPVNIKLYAGVLLAIIILGCAGFALVPKFMDPSQALARIARRVAAGPKSGDDAKQAKAEFDSEMRNFLKQNPDIAGTDLVKRLNEILPSSAFEVHVFALPHGLQLVEIDTLLQASDYLIMKSSTNLNVAIVPELQVFDGARVVGDAAAPVLVLLGHTASQNVHHPIIRTFSLLPDDLVDQTAKTVPEIQGDGAPSFVKNGHDIALDYSLYSLACKQNIFSDAAALPQGLPDENLRGILRWNGERYEIVPAVGRGQLAALYAFALSLSKPHAAASQNCLSENVRDFLHNINVEKNPRLVITKLSVPQPLGYHRHSRRHQIEQASYQRYQLQNEKTAYQLDLAKSSYDKSWTVTAARQIANPQSDLASAGGGNTTNDTSHLFDTKQGDKALYEADKAEKLMAQMQQQSANMNLKTPQAASDNSQPAMDKTRSLTDNARSAADTTAQDTQQENTDTSADKAESSTTGSASIVDQIEGEKVKLRSGAGSNYRTVASIPKGSKITVLSKKDGWYKVRASGKIAYIYGALVDYKTPDAYETVTIKNPQELKDEHQHQIADSRPGDRLVVIGGIKDGKYRVQLSSGKIAYINKDAVDVKIDTPQFVP